MGILDKVSREDREEARVERDSQVNPPDYDPGMDDEEGLIWNGDDKKDGGSDSSSSWLDGPAWGNSSNNNNGWGSDSTFNSWGNSANKVDNGPSTEDKIFDALKDGAVGVKGFIGEFVESFKTFDANKRVKFSKVIMGVSAGTIVASIILMFLGQSWAFGLMIGCMINMAWGIVVFMFGYESMQKGNFADREENLFDDIDNGGRDDEIFTSDEDESEDYEDEDDDLDFADYDDEDDIGYDDTSNEDMFKEEVEQLTVSKEEILDRISNAQGMLTRQYLYECNIGMLRAINKNFNKPKIIKEGSEEFAAWDAVIRKSAELFRSNQEDMPYLIEAKEKLFYTMLEVKRVKWIKNLEALVSEIVSIYSYDKETGKKDKSVYGLGDAVGDAWIIRIMKGNTAKISLKDAYSVMSDKIKDVYMPVVLGVDAEGSVVWEDFKSLNSLLVSGMPRAGKSWAVKSMIYQMAMYLSPSEMNIYFLDPKAETSDFRRIYLPHIKKFITTDAAILSELKKIVRVEGPRRKKIIGEAGCVNIWDYKKEHPDATMPLLYVIIDEVVTLSDRMDKETKAEFQGLLRELVSQLPAMGIRIFMIPHVIKDQVISKTTSDLIPCRISVGGDDKHIESTCGVKNFKHRLTHVGDMAVRIGNRETEFVHSVILADTNKDMDDMFDFLAKLWAKLEPESTKEGVYAEHMRELQLKGIADEGYSDEGKIEILNSATMNNVGLEQGGKDISEVEEDEEDEFDLWG